MKNKVRGHLSLPIVAWVVFVLLPATALAQLNTTFTYQGSLSDSGLIADGLYDFEFQLWDALSGGGQVGITVAHDDILVSEGVFSVTMDFGAVPFVGEDRWLLIRVREGSSGGGFTELSPRQALTPTPYALHAEFVPAGSITQVEIDSSAVQARILGSCPSGESIRIIDATGNVTCEVDTDTDTDTDTTYTAGAGLTLVETTFGVDSSMVQTRVGSSCLAGTYLVGINQDGSVQCAVLPVGLSQTLDSDGSVGPRSSIAVRGNGLPVIVYKDVTNDDLKLFDCSDIVCSAGIARTLDSDGDVGWANSVAIRANGLPVVSYWDVSNGELKLYDCTDMSCSTGVARTLATGGSHNDIAIRDNGLPVISYYAGDLNLYDCSNAACSAGTVRTLDTSSARDTSIAIRHNGLPIISYDGSSGLQLYDCSNTACSAGSIRLLDSTSGAGENTSIAIRQSGFPIISYYYDASGGDYLRVYDCGNTACSAGLVHTLNSEGGEDTSIAIRDNGLPIISYYGNESLKLFDCGHESCWTGVPRTLELLVGSQGTSIAIRDNGLPIISFASTLPAYTLKTYSCGDIGCRN